MPPPQFPFPLSLGTDLCRISRIHTILRSPRGARFVRKLLAPAELADRNGRGLKIVRRLEGCSGAETRGDGGPVAKGARDGDGGEDEWLWGAASFLAGRFAAKEAVMKAHPHIRLTLHRIQILSSPSAHDPNMRETARPRAWILGPAAPQGPPHATADLGHPEHETPGTTTTGGDPRTTDSEEPLQEALISITHDGDYASAVCLGYTSHPSVSIDASRTV